jgi:hypothetical protein
MSIAWRMRISVVFSFLKRNSKSEASTPKMS